LKERRPILDDIIYFCPHLEKYEKEKVEVVDIAR